MIAPLAVSGLSPLINWIESVAPEPAPGMRMNDPDPSLSSPSSKADAPSHDVPAESSDADPHQPRSNWFTRLFQSWMSGLTNPSLRSQMEGALADENSNDETFSAEEKAMLRNILELREMRVSDVMIPRADIDAVEDAISLGTLLAVYQDVGHSRLPVYRETLDDPLAWCISRTFSLC